MPVPETTSVEALDRYVLGRKIAASKGPAWRDVQLSVFSLPPVAEVFTMPAVTEPFIVWITSGEAEAQERENNGPWVTSRLKKGSLFLTAAGAPYDFRWKTLTSEPFEVVLVFLSLPLFNEALEDVFGANAEHARLRDVSGFEDPHLIPLLQKLREEATRPSASRLFVRGIAQAIAVHLARNYVALTEALRGETSSLPGFKLRRITDWMAEHKAEEFSLARLAEQAGMSEFHFNRLFKRATGAPPSHIRCLGDHRNRGRGIAKKQKVDAGLTIARTELAQMRYQREAMAVAERRGELITKRLVQQQAAYLMVTFRQTMLNLGASWCCRFVGLQDVHEAKKLIDEMARSTLAELARLPEKVTDPNWLESVEGDGQEDGQPLRPATGAEIRAKQSKAKKRRKQKTETMRKLRAEGRA